MSKYPINKNNKIASRKRRLALTAQGICNVCGQSPAAEGRKKCKKCLAYFVDYNRKNASKYEPRKKSYRQKLRKDVIEKYGNKCECCNEHRLQFLVIDHKNRDGNVERRKLFGKNGVGGSYSWYLKLRREPIRNDLRVLCNNCNNAIAMYGICPHELERQGSESANPT
jgi:hypothetical protein